MTRYLIEVSQEKADKAAKELGLIVHTIGSHFVTHADWRLKDGVCTGSMIAELDDRRLAFAIVPPFLRPNARVFELHATEPVN